MESTKTLPHRSYKDKPCPKCNKLHIRGDHTVETQFFCMDCGCIFDENYKILNLETLITQTDKNLVAFDFGMSMDRISMLNIVNSVKYNDEETYKIETVEGIEQRKISNLTEIEGVRFVSIYDVDIKDSLYYWYRNNYKYQDLPILIDNNIEIGEIYKEKSWSLSLMIQLSDQFIKVKLIPYK